MSAGIPCGMPARFRLGQPDPFSIYVPSQSFYLLDYMTLIKLEFEKITADLAI